MERKMWEIVRVHQVYSEEFRNQDPGLIFYAPRSDFNRNMVIVDTKNYPLGVLAFKFWRKLNQIIQDDLQCTVWFLHWLGIMQTQEFEYVSWKSFFWWIEVINPNAKG